MKQKFLRLRRLLGIRHRLRAAWALLTDPFARLAYSQEGEDLILERLFEGKRRGFYVDVGAHHPRRFSNTNVFYRKGWCGVNIDATPGSMKPFQKLRPRDKNIEAAVAAQTHSLTFYIYNEKALNSIVPPEQRTSIDRSEHHVVRQVTLVTRRLAEILAEVVPPNQSIDFLTIDVEGLDLEVLRSNDWRRFRPTYVLAEELRSSNTGGSVAEYMSAQGYSLYCRTMNTIFFVDDRGVTRQDRSQQ